VVLDAQGLIIEEFRFEHSIAGWNFWKQKAAARPVWGWPSKRVPGLSSNNRRQAV